MSQTPLTFSSTHTLFCKEVFIPNKRHVKINLCLDEVCLDEVQIFQLFKNNNLVGDYITGPGPHLAAFKTVKYCKCRLDVHWKAERIRLSSA